MKLPSLTSHQRWIVLLVITGFAIAFGVWARVYNLGYPHKQVFDEVYFPVFANDYLHHTSFFDVHPPLGKFFIALGIAVLGNTTVGWRIVPLLFGLGNIALMAYLWWHLTKDKVGTAVIAALMAIDSIFIVYSRTGLMDGILFFFIFASLLVMVKLKEGYPTVWLTTMLGLTASIKWVGLAVLAPVLYLAFRKKRWKEVLFGLPWSFLVYVGVVSMGQYLIGTASPVIAGFNWNYSAWVYQATLTATHPYSSPWWSWPILKKPVLFLYDVRPDGLVNAMSTRGNTMVWWVSSVIVVWSLLWLLYTRFVKKVSVADHPLMLFMVGYMACFLPFIPIHRVMFLYHYMPAYGFALLMLTYWLSELWKTMWEAVILFLFFAIVISIYFLPLAVGWIPVTQAFALRAI